MGEVGKREAGRTDKITCHACSLPDSLLVLTLHMGMCNIYIYLFIYFFILALSPSRNVEAINI